MLRLEHSAILLTCIEGLIKSVLKTNFLSLRVAILHVGFSECDCVAAVERPLESWVSLWNSETIRGSLKRPKWPKLASLA